MARLYLTPDGAIYDMDKIVVIKKLWQDPGTYETYFDINVNFGVSSSNVPHVEQLTMYDQCTPELIKAEMERIRDNMVSFWLSDRKSNLKEYWESKIDPSILKALDELLLVLKTEQRLGVGLTQDYVNKKFNAFEAKYNVSVIYYMHMSFRSEFGQVVDKVMIEEVYER